MPLTIAHPVVAVPFKRFGLLLSPLIVGSVVPDFEFFLRLSTGRLIAHTYLGLFLFCLPVGFLTLLLFHKFVKFPLISILPHSHQEKILPYAREFKFFPFTRFLNITISLLVGALSHFAFDSFTHHDGLVVRMLPFLSGTMFTLFGSTVRGYFFLQYFFSLAGIVFLIYWYWRWYKGAQREAFLREHHFPGGKRVVAIMAIVFSTVIGGIVYGIAASYYMESIIELRRFLPKAAIASVTSFFLSIVVFSYLWHRLVPYAQRVHLLERQHHTSQNDSPGVME
ncbi:conserved membrane-spanning protein [Chitinispirillum alkaliphilum]|nr:conserved membrane-spanning protein [Chitinispirillum alkaliphilum]